MNVGMTIGRDVLLGIFALNVAACTNQPRPTEKAAPASASAGSSLQVLDASDSGMLPTTSTALNVGNAWAEKKVVRVDLEDFPWLEAGDCGPFSSCVGESRRIPRDLLNAARWDESDPVLGPYVKQVSAIGQLRLKDKAHCTATHLGDGLMITAAHCFPGFKRGEACRDYKVKYESAEFNCMKIVSIDGGENDKVDVARFRIDLNGAELPEARLGSSGDHRLEQFMVFGYMGHLLFASTACSKVIRASKLVHDCCTMPIASGAPFLGLKRDRRLVIIAIHSGVLQDERGKDWATLVPLANW